MSVEEARAEALTAVRTYANALLESSAWHAGKAGARTTVDDWDLREDYDHAIFDYAFSQGVAAVLDILAEGDEAVLALRVARFQRDTAARLERPDDE